MAFDVRAMAALMDRDFGTIDSQLSLLADRHVEATMPEGLWPVNPRT